MFNLLFPFRFLSSLSSLETSCYGVTGAPEPDHWFCDRCKVKDPETKCELCPSAKGPMKKVKGAKKWAHVSCVMFMPKVGFGSETTKSPVENLDKVEAKRFQLTCNVCDAQNGAVIQCKQKPCKMRAHVQCVLSSQGVDKGFVLKEGVKEGYNPNLYFIFSFINQCPIPYFRSSKKSKGILLCPDHSKR